MDSKKLENAGLTQGEARVYIALLDSTRQPIGEITKKAQISSSKVYDVLGRLLTKGLVHYSIEGKTKYYQATEPKRILEYVENRVEQLKRKREETVKIIPELEMIYKERREENAEVLQGIMGIKTIFEKSLEETEKDEKILLLGYPKQASLIFNEYNKEYHKRRAEKGIAMQIIYNKDAWFCKKRESRRLLECRYLSEALITPAFLVIFNDVVGNIIVTDRQKACILVRNREVAESHKKYFAMLWKQAMKTE